MKFIVKYKEIECLFSINANSTTLNIKDLLDDIKKFLITKKDIPEDCLKNAFISLNGKTDLSTNFSESSIKDLGIVDRDILFILSSGNDGDMPISRMNNFLRASDLPIKDEVNYSSKDEVNSSSTQTTLQNLSNLINSIAIELGFRAFESHYLDKELKSNLHSAQNDQSTQQVQDSVFKKCYSLKTFFEIKCTLTLYELLSGYFYVAFIFKKSGFLHSLGNEFYVSSSLTSYSKCDLLSENTDSTFTALVIDIKDKIFWPLIINLHFVNGIRPGCCIYSLPQEVLSAIIMLLPIKDFLSFSQTCLDFLSFYQSECIWKLFCERDFPHSLQKVNTWKNLYIDHFRSLEKRRGLNKRNNVLLSRVFIPSWMVFNLRSKLFTQWPPIISHRTHKLI